MNSHPFATIALLLAVPAIAQQGQRIRFAVDADAAFALVLVSSDARLHRLDDMQILADAAVLLLPPRPQGFWQDVDLPVCWSSDIHWQAATYDDANGLRLRPPCLIDSDCPVGHWYQPGDVDADGDPLHGCCGLDRDGDAIADDGTPDDGSPQDGDAPCLPLRLRLDRFADAGTTCLTAWFDAPSDGYDLTTYHVQSDARTGIAEVFLYRKLPGPGEGMRDIVERHTTSACMTGSPGVRVYLAEGTAKQPTDAFAWRLVAALRR